MKLSDEQRKFLEERRFGVLATTNPNGSIQQSVMWYMLQGDTIVMNTLYGRRKHKNMVREPRISLCLEDEARYLTLAGTVALNEDPADGQRTVWDIAVRYDGEEEARKEMEESFANQHRVTINLNIESVDAHGF